MAHTCMTVVIKRLATMSLVFVKRRLGPVAQCLTRIQEVLGSNPGWILIFSSSLLSCLFVVHDILLVLTNKIHVLEGGIP